MFEFNARRSNHHAAERQSGTFGCDTSNPHAFDTFGCFYWTEAKALEQATKNPGITRFALNGYATKTISQYFNE
jgi:hypothetical protein